MILLKGSIMLVGITNGLEKSTICYAGELILDIEVSSVEILEDGILLINF